MVLISGKKLKVEAELVSKKNVSTGIGKGFGITIGVFLALIVIAVSCGILVSTQAEDVGRETNQALVDYQESVEKVFDEALPIDQRAKEKKISLN